MNKIPYNDYFLTMCFLVAQRSPDPSTKCGAVLVSADHRILSTGYNGPIKGADDFCVPLERPAKYSHILHAEENCIIAYNGSSQDLVGSTMYVTGMPCHKCLRMVLQKGIKKIIATDGNIAVMQANNDEEAICQKMLGYTPNVELVRLPNLLNVLSLLKRTEDYIIQKNPTQFPSSQS
jgi:dCMP deaminase